MDNEKEIQAVNRCAFGSTAVSLSVREHGFTSVRLSRQRVSSLIINHPSFQFLPLRGLNWIHDLPSFEILRPRDTLHGMLLHHFLLKLALAEKFPN